MFLKRVRLHYYLHYFTDSDACCCIATSTILHQVMPILLRYYFHDSSASDTCCCIITSMILQPAMPADMNLDLLSFSDSSMPEMRLLTLRFFGRSRVQTENLALFFWDLVPYFDDSSFRARSDDRDGSIFLPHYSHDSSASDAGCSDSLFVLFFVGET